MGAIETNDLFWLRLIRNSLLFDERWYKAKYEICGVDAAAHYLKEGYQQGFDPSPFFSTCKYLQQNPDIEASGMNPLAHYEYYGLNEENRRNFVDMKVVREAYPECTTDLQDGLLRLRVTNACNAKCRYCGVRLFFGAEKEHMMEKEWLFSLCKPLYEKINFLLLTGGDPNITPHSYDYMKFISENYPHITIMDETNGIAFDEKFQQLAAKYLFKVHVSVNASNAIVYNESCWEGPGGDKIYRKFMNNLRSYVQLLQKEEHLCFAPDVSMVINHNNYFDVLPFVQLALESRATGIGFFFDYTENNVNGKLFEAYPDFNRAALKQVMEIERVLANRVMVGFRLWVPTEELGAMQKLVDQETTKELQEKYASIVRLSEGRSIEDEHEERNRIRLSQGKHAMSFDEDYSCTIRLERRLGKDICFAPWKELDLYPSGRLDFCGWYTPTLDIKKFISSKGAVDWNEVINSYEFMRARYKILRGDYDECQSCCPMNDARNPILDVYKYSCPDHKPSNAI